MTMKCFLIILNLCILQIHCGVGPGLRSTPPLKDQKTGCFDETLGHLESRKKLPVPGKCAMAHCQPDGSIFVDGRCALRLMRAPNCSKDLPVDLTKPYPHCCPVKCIIKENP
ncbi:hypothetical protein TcasGA2_TC034391 [Tribolium castaneum]|uniref:Single domain-containing protein n=1 Tax=Tribolium castaneum TaxID=7070 RepID=A0A139WBJ2_TRICA|nr:hypothetical protein TcasGA2_TC034391 [Tribolium castaneum]